MTMRAELRVTIVVLPSRAGGVSQANAAATSIDEDTADQADVANLYSFAIEVADLTRPDLTWPDIADLHSFAMEVAIDLT